jgi:hypothetical protein
MPIEPEIAESAIPLTGKAKKTAADAFFALQLVLALISGGSEFLRLLSTAQGVNSSWLASWLAFLLLNLGLTIRGHRHQPSRVTIQTVMTYAAWTTVIAACLGAMLWKGQDLWDAKDTVTALVVSAGLALVWLWARWRGLGLADPMVHAGFAACFIGLPQLTLTYKIFTLGGAGMAGLMLLAGHIGICTRLGQLWFTIREAGWDRPRRAAALGELANEITWILVTLAWLVR